MPASSPVVLRDNFGRIHTDLRISITDRCNFRCGYCMPEEGLPWMERAKILSYEEIIRVARILVRDGGVKSIRITGGEPTVRTDLHYLVAGLAELGVDLAMTTNGATLAAIGPRLRAAGLRRINISLDSLQADRFTRVTRRDRLDQVLEGIDAAVALGFEPVKLNVVLMRGINDDEIEAFLAFGRERGVVVRFIEFMPLDAQGEWSHDRVVPYAEILETAARFAAFEPVERGHAPAERFRYLDGGGEFGVIASVTQPFCGSCDRMRLTADGQLHNCLFAVEHLDLRALLRTHHSDEALLDAIAGEIRRKREGHAIGQVHFIRPSKSMSQLGG